MCSEWKITIEYQDAKGVDVIQVWEREVRNRKRSKWAIRASMVHPNLEAHMDARAMLALYLKKLLALGRQARGHDRAGYGRGLLLSGGTPL